MSHWSLLDLFHFLGSGVCHQLPARSLQAGGHALPLCARDTGTYLGLALGLLAILLLRRARASLVASWPVLACCGLFFVAWGADGLNSYLVLLGQPHVYEPSNTLRLLTGILQGLALIIVVWPVAAFTFWRQAEHRRVIRGHELALLVGIALLVVALLSLPLDFPRYVAGILSGLGLVGMFTLLNTLLVAVALRREGTADTPRDVLRLLAIALVPALAELVILSLLRHWLLGF
ncbi:MAG TPA: DUF2085 domain-containing protein [Anaerolineae bacterium]|nr:DUF2085 domain-containing protein [Anaerolineae bacterium]HOR01163.1 DUF2085 domain-containing protein [Anaerolineae bacterium]